MSKTDPRIERTQEALRSALISLIGEKGFDAVTVQDITTRARLNRATFYLHFRDKQDLLLRATEAVFDRLAGEAEPLDEEDLAFDQPPRQVVRLFQHLADHRDFYKAVLGSPGVGACAMRMKDYVAGFTKTRLTRLHGFFPASVPLVDDDFIGEFIAGALVGVVTWWLDSGLPHSPEYMADRFGWLGAAGSYRMLGLNPPSLDAG